MAEIELDTMWRDTINVRGVWVHSVLPFGEGVLSAAFDVTEERRRERELREFAAVAAHDLREPLIGVHLMAGLLSRRPGLGDKEREMVATCRRRHRARAGPGRRDPGIRHGARRRGGARGRLGAGRRPTCSTSLGDADRSTAGRVEVGELPVLHASRTGLSRVFQNLIANALKFHDGDAPVVAVSASHDAGRLGVRRPRQRHRPARRQRDLRDVHPRRAAITRAAASASRPAGGSSRATAGGTYSPCSSSRPTSSACRRPASGHPITPGLPCQIYLAGRGRGVQREAVDPPSSKAQA